MTTSQSILDRYTDEALQEATRTGCPGDRNSAPYLLKLDTPERRFRAVSEAHTLSNLLGYRHSEAVYEASLALRHLIASGNEADELYGEKTARMDRERQQAMREAGWVR